MNSMELDDEALQDVSTAAKPKPGEKATQPTSTGRLANLMSADIDAITSGRDVVMITIGVPLGTIAGTYGLYKLMDWPALLGVALIFLCSPISLTIAQRMAVWQRDLRKIQDSRISVISEYLASIRAIKYFAWENAVIQKINEIRFGEQKKIWYINIM
jgi:ABC-type multidrug transport system fused ATPase/permease subunit